MTVTCTMREVELDDYRRGQRDALNAVLSLNPEAAAEVAKWAEKDPDPEGRLPFDVALWVSRVANQLGFETLEGDGAERFQPAPISAEDVSTKSHPSFDLVKHLHRQRAFSERTFGPGARTAGVVDHIRKELREIEADPTDIMEWIDVVMLALDGAWRAGGTPEQIAAGIAAKQTKNEGRTWPDWRTADPNKAIEHDRSAEAPISDKGETER